MKSRPTENPPNRFHDQVVTYDDGEAPPPSQVTVIDDQSRSILAHNDSPDLGFRWSVNPYRGCQHACAYCYARPTHEYLDLGAGTDFDTKIVVKRDAAALLREAFDKPSWRGELVMFSGRHRLLPADRARARADPALPRGLPRVPEPGQRDLEERAGRARHRSVPRARPSEARFGISVSLAFSDNATSRAIEPWAPSPDRRFKLIETLAAAGMPVGVMCAPIIPGVNDSQMVTVLERAAAAGAQLGGLGAAAPAGRGQAGVRGPDPRARCRSPPTRSCTASARPAAATSCTTRGSACAAAARAPTPR